MYSVFKTKIIIGKMEVDQNGRITTMDIGEWHQDFARPVGFIKKLTLYFKKFTWT